MAKKDKPQSPEEQAADALRQSSYEQAMLDYEQFVQNQATSIWENDSLPFDLSLEDQLFVRSYVIDRNEVAAMKRLGHMADDKTLRGRAKRHLLKIEVQSAIEFLAKRMMAKLDITAEKVQKAIAAVAFFDIREVAQFDQYGARLLNSRFWTAEQAMAIKKIKQGQHGLEIEMYDRLKATEMLSKQLNLQPEELNAAEAARIAADEAMAKIGTVLGRLLPGGKEAQEGLLSEDRVSRPH